MASISRAIEGADPSGKSIRYERIPSDPEGPQRRVLAVLLTGKPKAENPAVDRFLRFSRAQGLSLCDLWAALDRGRPVAAALVVPIPGRTAMIFISPTGGAAGRAGRLIATACAAQDPQQMRLVQALLDPEQTAERRALERAGFHCLATFSYMQRRLDPRAPIDPEDSAEPDGVERRQWSEAERRSFADAILASYEDTLDCPGLLGLRTVDDVIAGHMATGVFDPALWWAYYDRDEPVGVMLVNQVPQQQRFELAYLGVSVPFRGRGVAGRLLGQGLIAAAARGGTSIVLAVDESNEPALRLYRGRGFTSTARKTAMIWPLPSDRASSTAAT